MLRSDDPNSYYFQSVGDGMQQLVRRSDNKTASWQSEGDAGGYYVSPEGNRLTGVEAGDSGVYYYYDPTPPQPVAPVTPAAPAAPDYSGILSQFAGGMVNRGPIGVPQVRAGGNYAPMYSMPNAASQPFSFINPGSGGGLLGGGGAFGSGFGNGSIGSAQPFGAPMGGGLLGGK